ncbi:hypothetical protein [Streptomyces cylindrosporus]|uniref:Uncharacterized protein n=1 Tax=Streptomyces cylindrosporus TaxID=2927583 RepID=A0ABS9YJP7_9ACTN|nr:hypothetical protein [Streptomyces cylindrosporus]MCI3277483.1 hypothetical protein [Streptomyces cylindrosporus]
MSADEQRRKVLADVAEAYDVPVALLGTESERVYLHHWLTQAVAEAWKKGAETHQLAKKARSDIVDAVMPIVGQLQEQRDSALRPNGRAYGLARTWQRAHGSAMFLVRAAGAELLDVLDDSGAQERGVVHPEPNGQASQLHRVDEMPVAAECSAQYYKANFGPARQCIRAAQHHGDHIDEHGFHWSDTVAAYPVVDDQQPTNQGLLTGIEVRDPCPYCESCPLIPRTLLDDHVREHHPDVAIASHENGSSAPTEPPTCEAYRTPATAAETGLCARCGMYDYKHHVASSSDEGGVDRAEPAQRQRDALAQALREALAAFHEVKTGLSGTVIVHEASYGIHPSNFNRWRAALDGVPVNCAKPGGCCGCPHEMEA